MLALVAKACATREIAERLVLSKRTVDHHVSAILRKLGVRTRGEASVAGDPPRRPAAKSVAQRANLGSPPDAPAAPRVVPSKTTFEAYREEIR